MPESISDLNELRSFLEVLPLPAAILDQEQRFSWLNRTCLSSFGWHESDLIGQSFAGRIFASADEREAAKKWLESDGIDGSGVVIGGQEKRYQVFWFRVPSVDGQTIVFLKENSREPSRLDLLKLSRLERLSALGEVAAGIAHEINGPLSLASGLTQLLKLDCDKDKVDPGKLKTYLQKIDDTLDRMARIVRGLRHASSEGDRDPFERVSVVVAVNDAIELCRARCRKAGVQMIFDTPSDDILIECRMVQITQVVSNLLVNALAAVMDRPEKWIRCSVDDLGPSVRIAVMDSGAGIPVELRNRIMEPFFTTKASGEGTGLGLSISRGLIAEHGGSLELDPGCAFTRFVIEVPKAQSALGKIQKIQEGA